MRVFLLREESRVAGWMAGGLRTKGSARQAARRVVSAGCEFARKSVRRRCGRGSCPVLALCWLVLLASAVQCQTTTASLQGVVSNESGARFPGVRVILRNLDTNSSTMALSDNLGSYFCGGLAPGRYTVSASAPAHAALQVEVTLSVGEARVLNFRLLAAAEGSAPPPASSVSQS